MSRVAMVLGPAAIFGAAALAASGCGDAPAQIGGVAGGAGTADAAATGGTGVTFCQDKDHDGFCSDSNDPSKRDCDDNDPKRYPGAVETCNLLDDDCDGVTDNGVQPACQFSCVAPNGGCETVTAIAAGQTHVCALTSTGNVLCWGTGTLGIPELSNSTVPVRVPGVSGAKTLISSGNVTCASAGNEAICWGGLSAYPYAVPLPDGTKQIAVSDSTFYVLLADGTVEARALAQSSETSATFAPVSTTPQVAVLANGNVFCMLDAAGALQCPKSAKALAVNGYNVGTAAVTVDGSVCYTANIGLDCVDTAGKAQVIAGRTSTIAIGKGNLYSCALDATGTVNCWSAAGPTTITDATALAVGNDFGCVLRTSGKVSCWGSRDFGALGDAKIDTSQETEPIDVGPGLSLTLPDMVLLRSPALGACDSLSDVSAVSAVGSSLPMPVHAGELGIHAQVKSCGSQCANRSDQATCIASCAKNLGLSPACFGCYATLASCTGAGCYDAFNACAGFAIDFLSPVDNQPRFACLGAECLKGAPLAAACVTDNDCLSGACDGLPGIANDGVCVVSDGAHCTGSSSYCNCDIATVAGAPTGVGYCGACTAPGRIGVGSDCLRSCSHDGSSYCAVGQECFDSPSGNGQYCK